MLAIFNIARLIDMCLKISVISAFRIWFFEIRCDFDPPLALHMALTLRRLLNENKDNKSKTKLIKELVEKEENWHCDKISDSNGPGILPRWYIMEVREIN